MDTRIMITQPMVPGVGIGQKNNSGSKNPASAIGFQETLDKAAQGLKFSQHAIQRLNKRQIPLTEVQMNKLADAVDKAAQKGARESLIMMQDVAFVVSVKNKTVITAVDGTSLKDNVFTQIDSAVIIPE